MPALPFASCPPGGIGAVYDFDRINDYLSDGSFATVFRAIRRSDQLPVALKVIDKSKLETDRTRQDVINEVQTLRQLNHTNCLKFIEAFQSANEVFIVTELLQGKELFQYMKESGALAEKTAANIIVQILQGLRYLHQQLQIVHRDIKPENIIVSPVADGIGRVVIVDYGFAKHLGTSARKTIGNPVSTPSLPGAGGESNSAGGNSPMLTTPCGTLKFSSPEAVRNAVINPHDHQRTTRRELPKRDIYSVGIIAYTMLSGMMPFAGATKEALAVQMEKGVTFNGVKWVRVSEEGKAFVARLLQFLPASRPTAEEALQDPWLVSLRSVPVSPSVAQLMADGPPEADEPDNGEQTPLTRVEMRSRWDDIMDQQQPPGATPSGSGADDGISPPPSGHGSRPGRPQICLPSSRVSRSLQVDEVPVSVD